jgi:hypothetical protein
MKAVVFTGPTLPPAEAATILEAEYLPPAAIGDVYRAALQRPWAIGIIDGFFESTPSVWHREVLWAMAQGIHVFGAASMGALRAAELSAFGMVGVGEIFAAYRDGVIEDDDEVAVVHGPPELGYVQLSEAMVNIRASLRRATAARIIEPATAARLIEIGKALFYKERSYQRLLAGAAEAGLPAAEIGALRAWLQANQVNQKRLDAVALLQAVGTARAQANGPMQAAYRFERTSTWEAVERQFAPDGSAAGTANNGMTADLLGEPRPTDDETQRDTLLRQLARREAERQGVQPGVAELSEATRTFCRRRGLASQADLEAWLTAQRIDRASFLRLMADEACIAWAERSIGGGESDG